MKINKEDWVSIITNWYDEREFPTEPAFIYISKDGSKRSGYTGAGGGMSGEKSFILTDLGTTHDSNDYMLFTADIDKKVLLYTISENPNSEYNVYINRKSVMGYNKEYIRVRTLYADESYFRISPDVYSFLKLEFEKGV